METSDDSEKSTLSKKNLIDEFVNEKQQTKEKKGVHIINTLCKYIVTLEDAVQKNQETEIKPWREFKRDFMKNNDLIDKLLIVEDFIEVHKVFLEVKNGSAFNPYMFLPFMNNNTYDRKGRYNNNNNLNMMTSTISKVMAEQNKQEQEKIDDVFTRLRTVTEDINDLKYTNCKDAKEHLYGVNYTSFERDYKHLSRRMIGILSDTFNIYTKLIAKRERERVMFTRYVSMYGEAIKAKLAGAIDTNTGAGGGMENFFRWLDMESGLTPEGAHNQTRLDELKRKKGLL